MAAGGMEVNSNPYRYGDPLRPNGDIEMMKKMKCLVRPGGLLFLSVPVSKDRIIWNMHRIYGKLRLPMLLAHWKIEKIYATHEWNSRYGYSGRSPGALPSYSQLSSRGDTHTGGRWRIHRTWQTLSPCSC
jgi:hypothetical protein